VDSPGELVPIGSFVWARATGGRLTTRDRLRELARAIRSRLPRRATRAFDVLDPATIRAPDSPLARAAEQLCREVSPDWLTNHGLRSYLYARALGAVDGITRFDDELLYVAAVLHDLGLTERYGHPPTAGTCFSLASADGARELAARHGWSEARLDTLAATITYHLNVRVTLDDGVEAYLFNTGVALDVVGSRARELTPAQRDAVLARHPRTGFRDAFLARYRETAAAAPACRAAFHLRWLRFGRLVRG